MNDESHNDIFGLRLNEQGISYIRKFATFVRFVILTGVISSFFLCIIALGRIINDPTDYIEFNFWQTAYYKSFPYFTLVLNILFLIQIYFYWRISQLLKEAVHNTNEIAFNESFRALLKNAIWGVILGGATVIMSTIDLLFWINYW